MEARIWKKGILRDVYPWNFLTQTQLSRKVNALPLQYWVEQDPTRGRIVAVCEGMSLWELDPASLPAVRQSLSEAGIIFDWRKHLT